MKPLIFTSAVIAIFVSSALFAADTTVLVPPIVSPPEKVVEAPDLGTLLEEQAKFWAGLHNAKEQMARLEKARSEAAEKIPRGTSEKYDLVVNGDQFVGLFKSGEPTIGQAGSTKLATWEIKGTALTKAELDAKAELERKEREAKTAAEKLKVEQTKKAEEEKRRRDKAERDAAMDRDTHRMREEIERFKRAGGNYRAPAM